MKKFKLTTIAVAVSFVSGGGYAADTDQYSNANQDESQQIERMVITGKRFQNSLVNRLPIDPQDLPFTLDILDASDIEERGFTNPFDVLETIPNVFKRQTQDLPGGSTYLIRGLNSSVLTNNRPESDSRGAGRRDVSYIDRIEVAKGPASILLGPVIPGGVVNQVTKTPEDDDFVDYMVRAGSYNSYRVEVDANASKLFGTESVRGRITVAKEDAGSPQDEENTAVLAIRPVLDVEIPDKTRIQGSVAYTKRDGVQGSKLPVNADGSVPEVFDAETYLGIPSDRIGEDLYYDVELQHEFLDDLKLVVRGSYQDADFEYNVSQGAYNYDGGRGFDGPEDIFANVYYSRGSRDQDVTYGDVQLVGGFEAFGQRQDWVIGSSYKNEETISLWGWGGVLGTVDITNLGNTSYLDTDFSFPVATFFETEDTLYSIYGETNIRPIERLTIVAGIRYDELEAFNIRSPDENSDYNDPSLTNKYDDITIRVGGSYELTEQINGYLSYAESFIPQSGTIRSGEIIKPETATNYEIGLKGSLQEGRINFTAAAFSLTRENVATSDPENMPDEPSYVVTTGEQVHKGIEFGANINITNALNLSASYGYVDTEITKSNDGQEGQPAPLVPQNTFSLYGNYTFQEGTFSGFHIGLGIRGISERPSTRYDIDYDGYTLVDATVSYPLGEATTIQLNIHNLLDEEYRQSIGFDDGRTAGAHRFGNPRSAYITLRSSF
jgi:TonB-dependent siderophore receptor